MPRPSNLTLSLSGRKGELKMSRNCRYQNICEPFDCFGNCDYQYYFSNFKLNLKLWRGSLSSSPMRNRPTKDNPTGGQYPTRRIQPEIHFYSERTRRGNESQELMYSWRSDRCSKARITSFLSLLSRKW